MPNLLPSVLRDAVDLAEADLDWIHRLMADWQLIADLSTSDLVLWIHTRVGRSIVASHTRPSGGITVHLENVVRQRMPASREAMAMGSLSTAQIQSAAEPYWTGTAAIQEEYTPVVHAGAPIAVVTRETSVGVIRGRHIVEREMEEIAEVLCQMTASGEFPIQDAGITIRHSTPRVADGILCLDGEGRIVYISPNERSCFRRPGIEGELEGILLTEAVTSIIPTRTPVDETLAVVLMGRQAWLTEVEVGGVFLSVHSIPLTLEGHRSGAVFLVRDVTEVRRREQALLNKDVTIREVHHRIKNNLQTVLALLRMQARRASNEGTRQALSKAEHQVTTVAAIHDTLSHNVSEYVDLDKVFSSILRMAAVVATPTDEVSTKLEGSFGVIDANTAQTLTTVLAELVTNAVEHGLDGHDGRTMVMAHHDEDRLGVHVTDNGVDLAPDTLMTGLGTWVVTAFVREELRGVIDWEPLSGGGIDVIIYAHLHQRVARAEAWPFLFPL